jgi:peptidoglycan hydrolase CwlO-like protein
VGDLTLKQVGRHLLASLSSILVILGLLWTIARPHAEEMIRGTVRSEQFATKEELEELNTRLKALDPKLNELSAQQRVMNSEFDTMQELQREQRNDLKTILRSIRSLEN